MYLVWFKGIRRRLKPLNNTKQSFYSSIGYIWKAQAKFAKKSQFYLKTISSFIFKNINYKVKYKKTKCFFNWVDRINI